MFKQQVIDLIKERNSVFLYGKCGVGKTFLGRLIRDNMKTILIDNTIRDDRGNVIDWEYVKENPEHFTTISFVNFLELIKTEVERISRGLLPERKYDISSLKRDELLIIDEVGAEKASEWNMSLLFEIIDYRLENNLPTLIISNYNLDSLKTKYNKVDSISSERIISRLHSYKLVKASGRDRRIPN